MFRKLITLVGSTVNSLMRVSEVCVVGEHVCYDYRVIEWALASPT